MSKKWFEKPMVISAVQNTRSDSYDILYNHTAKHFNTEQLYHLFSGHTTNTFNDAKHGEKLQEYLKEAKKLGIAEIVYVNIHSSALEGIDKKWLVIQKDGSYRRWYEIHYLLCLNDDYTREVVHQLTRLCSYGVDGIFLDGPISTGACYCPHCKKMFSEMFGKDISEASEAELLKFNLAKVKKFMKTCRDTVKSLSPDVMLYINNSALRADITGANTREISEYVDFLGAEGGFIWLNRETSLWHLSPQAKLIETQAQGRPAVTFIAGDWKPWTYIMHTPEETTIFCAQAIANGTNVWYGVHFAMSFMEKQACDAALKLNHFVLDHPEIFTGHKPVSRVALLWGQDTANSYRSAVEESDFTACTEVGAAEDIKSDHAKAFRGCVEMLSRAHVQYDVIDEVSVLQDELEKYDLLILPTVACLREGVAEKIEAFVKAGGNLISTYDTGFYTRDGMRTEEPQLKNLQGIASVERFIQYQSLGTCYLRAKENGAYAENLRAPLFSGYQYVTDVTPTQGAKVHFEANEPMRGRYDAFPQKWFPAVIETSHDKGKSVYFTGDVGDAFLRFTHPDMEKCFINTVRSLSRPLVTTDAPGTVEMVLRKCEEGYALHLINLTGEMMQPISRIIELRDLRISLSLSDVKGEVHSLMGADPIQAESKDGVLIFTLPSLKDYDVIVIK